MFVFYDDYFLGQIWNQNLYSMMIRDYTVELSKTYTL